jgi:TPR repeat protein
LFRQAAELNYPIAMVNLSICYSLGKGVVADDEQAIDWWMKAVAVTKEGDEGRGRKNEGYF